MSSGLASEEEVSDTVDELYAIAEKEQFGAERSACRPGMGTPAAGLNRAPFSAELVDVLEKRPSLLVKSTSLYPCPGPTISKVSGGTKER